MKLVFVRPNMHDGRSSDAMEPLAFAILKSLTPSDVDVQFFDERLEPIPFDIDVDLVAMTVETYTARRAYRIATEFRQRGAKVVLGGYHPTFLPDEALEHTDYVIRGEAEEALISFIETWENGRNFSKVPNLSYLTEGKTIHNPFIHAITKIRIRCKYLATTRFGVNHIGSNRAIRTGC